jgi:hypothetical protein
MADSGFPFFSLIIQIATPVNELERLARFLSLHLMRVKVLGLSHFKDIAKKYRIILPLRSSSVIMDSFFPFPMSKAQSLSQKPTNDDGQSRRETRQQIPAFRRGPGSKGGTKEKP